MRTVIPVIHFLDAQTALDEAAIAFACGASGVILISHLRDDDALLAPAAAIKGRHPEKLVGLNFLSRPAIDCLQAVIDLELDLAWMDNPGVSSRGISAKGAALAALAEKHRRVQVFGSVAFKYQPHEPDPAAAAAFAAAAGFVTTTSGTATGNAPEVEKIAAMRARLGDAAPLAIASGMSPENVGAFVQHTTHFLVSTHVSRDEYHIDPRRLEQFVAAVSN